MKAPGRDALRHALFFGGALLLAAATALAAKPPKDDDCLACHGDSGAKREDGRSVFVAAKRVAASVHGQAGLACVDCHTDLAKTADFPHPARLKPPDCTSC